MDYRQGTCGSCKSSFRVPASFTANKAKCPKCGGVVELGATQAASADKPAAEKPRPVPASVPASRPAAPAATAKPAAAAVKPAPAPVVKPVAAAKPAAAVAQRAPAPKPAAEAPKPTVRTAAEAAAQRVRAGASTGAKPEAAAGEPKHRERLGRERASMKHKSWGPTIGAVIFLAALVGAAGWYFVWGSDDSGDSAQAATTTPTNVASAQPAAPAAPLATEPEPEPAVAAAAVEEAPKPEEVKPVEKELVDDVDLLTLAEQTKLPETSDEDWKQIVEWADSFTDPMAGAAGNRARAKLLAKGKEAFPALMNEFRLLDLTTEDGYRTGDLIQKLLMEICHGNNFGWQYSTELKDVIFNKKAIRAWHVQWERARDNEEYWRKLAKLDQAKPAEGDEPPADAPKKKDDLDDF